jgi:hypothetical protein
MTKELDALRDKVRTMKMQGIAKSEIAPEVKKLLALKKTLGAS